MNAGKQRAASGDDCWLAVCGERLTLGGWQLAMGGWWMAVGGAFRGGGMRERRKKKEAKSDSVKTSVAGFYS